jgi:hypothetical protein
MTHRLRSKMGCSQIVTLVVIACTQDKWGFVDTLLNVQDCWGYIVDYLIFHLQGCHVHKLMVTCSGTVTMVI